MVKNTKKQNKNNIKEGENHHQTEQLGSTQLEPQNTNGLNPWFKQATKNMLLNLSKKCRSIRKDSQIRKQWERQYLKNKNNKQLSIIQANHQRDMNQQQKERLPPIQHLDDRKQSKKRIQYQNQYLNKFLKDKQQKQVNNSKKRKANFQLFKKWQNYYIEEQDQYMEVQLDQIDTLRSHSNIYGKQISFQSNSIEDQAFDYQQKEISKKDINESAQKKMKSNFENQDSERKQRIQLYNLTLDQLISLFISELISPQYKCLCSPSIKSHQTPLPEITTKTIVTSKCKCDQPTAVHRTVAADLHLCLQIQKIITLLGYQNRFENDFIYPRDKKEYFQKHVFNQDRTILLYNKGSLKSEIFSQEIVTPFDHRALAMLLKRINHKKYSVLKPKFSTNQRIKNYLVQKFYKEQYEKSIEQYYKQLLQLQLEYKRYAQIIPSSEKIVIGKKIQKLGPSNFIRRMLTNIFQDKIRGTGLIKKEISQLEQEIDACAMAEILLGKMRQNEMSTSRDHLIKQQLNILPKILFENKFESNKIVNQNEQSQVPVITINKKYKFNPDLVGVLIDQNQKKSIQRTLLRFQKNRKQVPYPKCMFLQYRLRALRQQSYKNPNNPSSDQDQQLSQHSDIQEQYDRVKNSGKLKDLHVYKGYRGYKTQLKIMEARKRKKGITKNVQMYSNQELFYLRSLQDPTLNKKKQNEHFQEQRSDDLKQIPFPFYLSIFNQKKDQKGISFEKIVDQNHNNNNKKTEVIDLSD